MIKVYFKFSDDLIVIDDNLYCISIESLKLFRDLVYSLDDNIIVSKNNEELMINKQIYIIDNNFALDPNTKKNLNYLYKSLDSKDYECNENLQKIDISIKEFLESLIIKNDFDLTYDYSLELIDLLNLYEVKFQLKDSNEYLENLLNYISIISLVTKCKLFVSFNLINNLSDEEINNLKIELRLKDIFLIDFKYESNKNIVNVTVDKDYCVI